MKRIKIVVGLVESQAWSRRSWQLFTSISSPSRHRSPRRVVLSERHLRAERQSSMVRPTALAATFSRFSLSREIVSTLPVRSAWIRRSPTHMYRPAPLAGLWSHQKGGFYHDGRFATLPDVIETTMSFSNWG
jgi:hypothetical protein